MTPTIAEVKRKTGEANKAAVARIAVDFLEGLDIRPPQPTVDLGAIRKADEEAAHAALELRQ
jgi:hypothetical protein